MNNVIDKHNLNGISSTLLTGTTESLLFLNTTLTRNKHSFYMDKFCLKAQAVKMGNTEGTRDGIKTQRHSDGPEPNMDAIELRNVFDKNY